MLAIPYALGFTGDSLISAGFLLNAIFYLVFLFGWSVAIVNWIPNVRARNLALILLGCSGHPAYAALAQSDTGFWLAASALMLAALSAGWFWTFALLLVISPWVRPEGIFCGMAFFTAAIFARKNERSASELWLAIPFALSVIGVFALNFWLTGAGQFSSIAHKGYFKQLLLHSAICYSYSDAITMLREIVFSCSPSMPRSLLSVPIIGGVLFVAGVWAHDWNRPRCWKQLAWLGAAVLGFLSVAQSQWQGTNMDRYLAWLTPILFVSTAEGVANIVSCFAKNRVASLVPLLVVVYAIGASAVYVCIFNSASRGTDLRRSFAKACDSIMGCDATVASASECGLAYFMRPRHMANLDGLYSPEFEYMSFPERIEDLKHNPGKRFDYWILGEEFGSHRAGEFSDRIFGPCVLAGPNAFALHEVDWTDYDISVKPPASKAGESLVASVDIGYPPDEKKSNYEILERYSRPKAEPFFRCSKDTSGRVLLDSGRIVVGGDSMDVHLAPGRDVRVVIRIVANATVVLAGEVVGSPPIKGNIPETFSMNVAVDGQVVEKVTLKCDQKWFSEVEFTIPGSAITKEVSRISFLGDHIPCGYWFYQKK